MNSAHALHYREYFTTRAFAHRSIDPITTCIPLFDENLIKIIYIPRIRWEWRLYLLYIINERWIRAGIKIDTFNAQLREWVKCFKYWRSRPSVENSRIRFRLNACKCLTFRVFFFCLIILTDMYWINKMYTTKTRAFTHLKQRKRNTLARENNKITT